MFRLPLFTAIVILLTLSAQSYRPAGHTATAIPSGGPAAISSLVIPADTILVSASLATAGEPSDDRSLSPSVSADGRFVAFASGASNLVSQPVNLCGGDPCQHIYIRNLQTGETQRASIATDGALAFGDSALPSISADGRFVAFESRAANLVQGDSNTCIRFSVPDSCDDVFVHDRTTGETTRVSVSASGAQGNSDSFAPSISGDGRFVAFASAADNFVAGDNDRCNNDFDQELENCLDVFVHDRQTGQTSRVSLAPNGSQADCPDVDFLFGRAGYQGHCSDNPSISADGRFIAFESRAGNLVPGDPAECSFSGGQTSNCRQIFVRDREAGITSRISVSSSGEQGNGDSFTPSISGDGRFVAFASQSTNLVPADTNGRMDVFLHDRQTGQTRRVSVSNQGSQGNGNSFRPSISAQGRFIAFTSGASNLVPNDTNVDCADPIDIDHTPFNCADIFRHDAQTGDTVRVSVASDGNQADGCRLSAFPCSDRASTSADGMFIAFESDASDLVPEDANDKRDVFARRMAQVVLSGDVDCNQEINAVDALKSLRSVAGLAVSQAEPCPDIGTEVASLFGDVDCSDAIDAIDALKILRFVAGLIVEVPLGCPALGE